MSRVLLYVHRNHPKRVGVQSVALRPQKPSEEGGGAVFVIVSWTVSLLQVPTAGASRFGLAVRRYYKQDLTASALLCFKECGTLSCDFVLHN